MLVGKRPINNSVRRHWCAAVTARNQQQQVIPAARKRQDSPVNNGNYIPKKPCLSRLRRGIKAKAKGAPTCLPLAQRQEMLVPRPAAASIARPTSDRVRRIVRLRLSPASVAGDLDSGDKFGRRRTFRLVWNYLSAYSQWRYARWGKFKFSPKPGVSFFTLGKQFTPLRHHPQYECLQAFSILKVPYNLKYLADAFWGISEKTARLSRLQAQAPDTGQFHHCQRCEVREPPFVHPPYRQAASEGPNLYVGGTPLQANA